MNSFYLRENVHISLVYIGSGDRDISTNKFHRNDFYLKYLEILKLPLIICIATINRYSTVGRKNIYIS